MSANLTKYIAIFLVTGVLAIIAIILYFINRASVLESGDEDKRASNPLLAGFDFNEEESNILRAVKQV